MSSPLLEIKNLTVHAKGEGASVKTIINNINLNIPARTITALVGGSGSGKTTTGRVVINLLGAGLYYHSGVVLFQGKDLRTYTFEQMRRIRGGSISMVFQEPLLAFNPLLTIGYQIEEVLLEHTTLVKHKRQERILELLDRVGVSDPKRIAGQYPHQLSGGLRQRAMIAQALAAEPQLIIADEPTSNLDVTLQARIMDVFRQLKQELNIAILLISHDLGLVEHLADYVAIMSQGCVVEQGGMRDLLSSPKHEYTKALLNAYKL